MTEQAQTSRTRRRFIGRLLGLIGVTATGAVVAQAVRQADTATDSPDSSETPVHSSEGYHETEHIRTYYDKARF